MFLALRDLRHARGRFALMGAVVGLIAVLGVILTGLASGLAEAGVSALRALPATHLAFDRNASGELFSRSTVTAQTWQSYAKQPGVAQASPLGQSLTHAVVTRGAAPDTQLSLAVFGVEAGSFMAPTPVTGQPLNASSDGILISKEVADQGVRVGDVLTVDQTGLRLPVVGQLGAASFGHVGVVYAPLATWQRINYGLPGTPPQSAFEQATAIALRLDADADLAAIDQSLGTQTITREATFAASPGYTAESSTMSLIKGFLYLISALVVGAFFTVWTVQRRGEIALLKALGASTRYILADALGQVLAVLVGATAIGTAIGVGLGSLMSGSAPFALQVAPVAMASLLLIVLGVLGALVAVRRITAVDPLIALGGNR